MNFFDTSAGHNFASYTVPELIRAIEANTRVMKEYTAALQENSQMLWKHTQALRDQQNDINKKA